MRFTVPGIFLPIFDLAIPGTMVCGDMEGLMPHKGTHAGETLEDLLQEIMGFHRKKV